MKKEVQVELIHSIWMSLWYISETVVLLSICLTVISVADFESLAGFNLYIYEISSGFSTIYGV